MAKLPEKDFEKDMRYDVWVYGEMNALSNFLGSLCMFRHNNPGLWPSMVRMSSDNRLASWKFAEAVFEVNTTMKMAIKDAIYIAYYKPWEDNPTKRTPTKKPKKRTPVEDVNEILYRSRSTAKEQS